MSWINRTLKSIKYSEGQNYYFALLQRGITHNFFSDFSAKHAFSGLDKW